ncbi:MAG: response regulator [Polyangiaceae bacterium]|nr:response regulator [Polyangiaceae bacterium]
MTARILIVDDNQNLAKNLRDVLEGASELGAEVALAPTGRQAREHADREGFDVAVVDVKLPDESGVDLIRPLRESCPHGEIVLLTGNATVDIAIAALRAGAFAFVLKSFRPAELISTVAQALEKVALKREREELERRYRAIVDAADVLIVGLDARGRVTLWNPRIAAVTGISTEEAVSSNLAENTLEEDGRRRFAQAFMSVRDEGTPRDVEVGLRDAMGAIRIVRWHLSAVKGSGNRVDLVYGIGIDVTERRALERRAQLAEALNAMAPLALGLAHEIRNPLNAAVLELHLLGRGIDRLSESAARDPLRARVRIVESEIKRLERLLTDFLELARPRAPQREPVDLSRVVEDVLELEAEAIASHHIKLVREFDPTVMALGDVEKLKQVVLNLVVNALDVMPDGGELRAFSGGDEREVWLGIADTGPGVDPHILAEIFDPFFTTKPAGTGLGLAIVRKLVEQHAGRVVVDTKKGEGTAVRVHLPRLHGAT